MAQDERKLRISDLILRALVVGLRTLGEIDSVLTNPYQYTHSLPYGETVITGAVQRLVRTGDLSRDGKGREAIYRLTEKGEQRVRGRISRFLVDPVPWDGRWRMVVYDIEESERLSRNRLRRFLKSVGFGMLQQSIWVSPYPVRAILEEFLEESGMKDVVLVVEADYVGGWGHRELASRVWKFARIRDEYLEFRKRCESATLVDQKLRQQFEWLIVHDPFLPNELFPLEELRVKAMHAYQRLLQMKP